ncbi:MAG: GH15 family glucan-1,4-alpha-glucosidase [Verrucomicrobiales bacterium]|jgi:GH15 family glucan-1,4-alpha-glucosidase
MPIPSENYLHGVIGNGRTCALIDPDSTIAFACLPDFDSGTVFASLLDPERGGHMRIDMVNGRATSQHYQRNTNILITEFEANDGTSAFRVIDFMPRYTWDGKAGSSGDAAPDIVRVLEPLRGAPEICVRYNPRLEYGIFPTVTCVNSCGAALKSSTEGCYEDGHQIYESVFLYTDLPPADIAAGEEILLDQRRYLLLSYHDKVLVPTADVVELMLQRTRSYWLLWSARTHLPDRYREEVIRSALALKLLQFDPTGAMVAAATTSLPETVGEERNWDYRFCWIRDGSMTVSTLRRIGHPRMASCFIDWMLRTVPTKDDTLQIMYGLRGEKVLTERTLDHLDGYLGSRPVRVGNAAYNQQQHDINGILLDVVYQDVQGRMRTPEKLDQVWTRVRAVVRTVSERWQDPDRGIWEIRGEMRHFVFSKVLCWVAVDRAIKIAQLLGKDQWAVDHQPLADEIHAQICDKGWSDTAKAFTQSYGSDELDSSCLLMAEYGFISPLDRRFVSTVEESRPSMPRRTHVSLSQSGRLWRTEECLYRVLVLDGQSPRRCRAPEGRARHLREPARLREPPWPVWRRP